MVADEREDGEGREVQPGVEPFVFPFVTPRDSFRDALSQDDDDDESRALHDVWPRFVMLEATCYRDLAAPCAYQAWHVLSGLLLLSLKLDRGHLRLTLKDWQHL